MNTPRQQLRSWLLPNDAAQTAMLVRASGLSQLKRFDAFVSLLVSRVWSGQRRADAVETFAQYEREAPAILFRRLASPVYRGWLSDFRMVKDFCGPDPVLERQVALWNNMRYSFLIGEYDTNMAVTNGCCMTWDPRLSVRVGPFPRVAVARRDDRLSVRTADDGALLLELGINEQGEHETRFAADHCAARAAPCLPGSDIVVRNDLPLLHLKLSDTGQRENGVVQGELDHSQQSYPPFDVGPFLEAAAILRGCWPEEFRDFQETLQVVVPRGTPPAWIAHGMTVSSHQGCIWILARGLLAILEHMVHEQSHVKLRYIEEACPILESQQTTERFTVGWRSDARPIEGIYEGVYVNLHVLMALRSALEGGYLSGEQADRCADRIRTLSSRVREALTLLVEHGRFTETGEAMPQWACATVSQFCPTLRDGRLRRVTGLPATRKCATYRRGP